MANLSPLPGYVLVRPSDSVSGPITYIKPTTEEVKLMEGVVAAVGTPVKNEFGTTLASPVDVGDAVVFRVWGNDVYKFKGVDYRFVKFMDLLGTIE